MDRTATLAQETSAAPDAVYAIVSDPRSLPRWAAAFADSVEGSDTAGWRVSKGAESFAVRIVANAASRTVDVLRRLPSGREGGAFIRVIERPGGGAVVVMTVPDPDGSAAAALRGELSALARLAEAG